MVMLGRLQGCADVVSIVFLEEFWMLSRSDASVEECTQSTPGWS